MTSKCPGERKFTELMPNHILCYKNLIKYFAIVDQKCHTHELGYDRTSPCPSFYWFMRTGSCLFTHLRKQLLIDEWSFFKRSSHLDLLNLQTTLITRPSHFAFYVLI